jgi:hypothetical protein
MRATVTVFVAIALSGCSSFYREAVRDWHIEPIFPGSSSYQVRDWVQPGGKESYPQSREAERQCFNQVWDRPDRPKDKKVFTSAVVQCMTDSGWQVKETLVTVN